jgi:hypothetical protein
MILINLPAYIDSLLYKVLEPIYTNSRPGGNKSGNRG